MLACETLPNTRKRKASNLKPNYIKYIDINLKIKTDCPKQENTDILLGLQGKIETGLEAKPCGGK